MREKEYDLSYYTYKCANEIGMMLYYKKDIVVIKDYLRILQQIDNLFPLEKRYWELCMEVINITGNYTLTDVKNIFRDNRLLSDEELSELDNENIVDKLDETVERYQNLYYRKSVVDSITNWIADFNLGKECDTETVLSAFETLNQTTSEIEDTLETLEEKYNEVSDNTIISSGIKRIDEYGATFMKGTINTVFGYTGSFKTMYCSNMAYQAIKQGLNVCYLSLEISATNMYYNMLSRYSQEDEFNIKIEHSKTKNKTLLDSESKYLFNIILPEFKKELANHLIILDESKLNSGNYSTMTAILKKVDDEFIKTTNKGIDVVVVDHINLLKFNNYECMNDYSKVNHWMSFFRKNCINFVNRNKPVCFVIVAQSSRSGYEKATAKEGIYTLDAIAEANEIERSSSVVLSIYTDAEIKKNNSALVQVLKGRDCGEMVEPICIRVVPEYYLVDDNQETLKEEIQKPIMMLDENGGGYDEKDK
jgi:replicative DNA helicase